MLGIFCCIGVTQGNTQNEDDCPVLCTGKLLEDVQLSAMFNDSKDFVDMTLLGSPEVILEKYEDLVNKSDPVPKKDLEVFVNLWFNFSSDVVEVTPTDFTKDPMFIRYVFDIDYRSWLNDLNSKWKDLIRKTPDTIKNNPRLYSSIYLPHSFVVPGGRFREMYYWDSYWIVEGLLLCNMKSTAKNMIENMLYLVSQYGHVPNGSRKYYIGRSQIPFLIPMMELYHQYTGDDSFIKSNLDLLDTEFEFWLNNRQLDVHHDSDVYSMFHYSVDADEPRAESYLQDYRMGQNISESDRNRFYSDIQSAAESGWDFSSRWFESNVTNDIDILDIKTSSVIPVDLNCLLSYNGYLLSKYHGSFGNETMSEWYKDFAETLNRAINRVLWDDVEGFWFDMDYTNADGILRSNFYASGLMPLWTNTYGLERNESYTVGKVLDYLKNVGVLTYDGGLPTSMLASGQQWDFPNGWAPLHHIAIVGLHQASVHDPEAADIAFDLAKKWVETNYQVYTRNTTFHEMMEKYDVVTPNASAGHGGFYKVQDGFGWTNGVIMKIFQMYPHTMHRPTREPWWLKYMPMVGLVGFIIFVLSAHFISMRHHRKQKERLDNEASGEFNEAHDFHEED